MNHPTEALPLCPPLYISDFPLKIKNEVLHKEINLSKETKSDSSKLTISEWLPHFKCSES